MKKFQYDTFPKPYAHFVKIDYKLTRHDILGIIIALTHQGSLFFFKNTKVSGEKLQRVKK